MKEPIERQICKWIVEILVAHKPLLMIAVRQRAKFEGWLKFELAALIEQQTSQEVTVEAVPEVVGERRERADLVFQIGNERFEVELKTPNTNWRIQGVQNRTRPITMNIASIIVDARKLGRRTTNGIVAFVLFPISKDDTKWHVYLQRISDSLGVQLSESQHCTRVALDEFSEHPLEVIVCSFSAPRLSHIDPDDQSKSTASEDAQ